MKYAYGLKTPSDLLNKARREFERMEEAESEIPSAVENLIDHGINAAVALWHITDWLTESGDAEVNAMRAAEFQYAKDDLNGLKDFQRKVRQASPELELCHRLGTGIKHFEFDYMWKKDPKIEESRVTMTGTEIVFGPRRLKIVDDQGVGHYASDVYKAALSYWEGFFSKHGIPRQPKLLYRRCWLHPSSGCPIRS